MATKDLVTRGYGPSSVPFVATRGFGSFAPAPVPIYRGTLIFDFPGSPPSGFSESFDFVAADAPAAAAAIASWPAERAKWLSSGWSIIGYRLSAVDLVEVGGKCRRRELPIKIGAYDPAVSGVLGAANFPSSCVKLLIRFGPPQCRARAYFARGIPDAWWIGGGLTVPGADLNAIRDWFDFMVGLGVGKARGNFGEDSPCSSAFSPWLTYCGPVISNNRTGRRFKPFSWTPDGTSTDVDRPWLDPCGRKADWLRSGYLTMMLFTPGAATIGCSWYKPDESQPWLPDGNRFVSNNWSGRNALGGEIGEQPGVQPWSNGKDVKHYPVQTGDGCSIDADFVSGLPPGDFTGPWSAGNHLDCCECKCLGVPCDLKATIEDISGCGVLTQTFLLPLSAAGPPCFWVGGGPFVSGTFFFSLSYDGTTFTPFIDCTTPFTGFTLVSVSLSPFKVVYDADDAGLCCSFSGLDSWRITIEPA